MWEVISYLAQHWTAYVKSIVSSFWPIQKKGIGLVTGLDIITFVTRESLGGLSRRNEDLWRRRDKCISRDPNRTKDKTKSREHLLAYSEGRGL